jgi:hypothetical protein
VQREGLTLLVGETVGGFATFPLCGQKLEPAQVEPARLRLQQGSISEGGPSGGWCFPMSSEIWERRRHNMVKTVLEENTMKNLQTQ